jgi:hypothetical protein
VTNPENNSTPVANVKVTELAEALLRLRLPETEKIIRHTSFKVIDSDQSRHEVANRLAVISHQQQHQIQLKEVVNQLNKEMGGLDPALINCLVFMSRATERWRRESSLDPVVKNALLKRRFILAALLMDQPEFVLNAMHPVNQLLTAIEKLFMGWEEAQGKPPAFFTKALAALTRLLDADHCLISEEQLLARDALYQEWKKENTRRSNLEKRQIQTETGIDNAQFAQWHAKATVHAYADGQQLPAPLVQLFETLWLDILRQVILTCSIDSSQYQRLKKLTQRLVFCYRGQHSGQQKQQLFSYAGQLLNQVNDQIVNLGLASDSSDQLLEVLNELMINILKGSEVAREVYHIDLPQKTNQPAEQTFNFQEVSECRGLWFRRFGKVCKFLTVLPQSQQILWSDFNGRKAGLEPWQAFLEELRAKEVTPIGDQVCIQDIFFGVAGEIVQLDKNTRIKQLQQLEKEKEIRRAAKQKAEEEARAILQAKTEATRKLQQENKELEERLAREAMEADERKRLLEEKAARQKIDGLPIGGWVMLEKNAERIKCKLGVRLNATGRLIFVDNFGMKIAEMLRDEAVQLILNQSFELLGDSADFEDRLARVVGRIGIAKR